MERIIQEKISADHLLYVSLKYTKTADVILNLIERWKSMINTSLNIVLEKSKKKKQIKSVPLAPRQKIDLIKELYKKNQEIQEAVNLFEFFKRIENAEKLKENEFRKNVTLKILDRGQWVDINFDTLKEYNKILERFISQIKQILSV